jgi:hypothetical protein
MIVDDEISTYAAFANPINPFQVIIVNENQVAVICSLRNFSYGIGRIYSEDQMLGSVALT